MGELISRQQAIDAIKEAYENDEMFDGYEHRIQELPSIQPDPDHWKKVCKMHLETVKRLMAIVNRQQAIIRCKDCKYWNSGCCEYPEHAVNCQDYWVGDIETEPEHFCGYAERKEDGRHDQQTTGD